MKRWTTEEIFELNAIFGRLMNASSTDWEGDALVVIKLSGSFPIIESMQITRNFKKPKKDDRGFTGHTGFNDMEYSPNETESPAEDRPDEQFARIGEYKIHRVVTRCNCIDCIKNKANHRELGSIFVQHWFNGSDVKLFEMAYYRENEENIKPLFFGYHESVVDEAVYWLNCLFVPQRLKVIFGKPPTYTDRGFKFATADATFKQTKLFCLGVFVFFVSLAWIINLYLSNP